jgi:hypothetical protein
MRRPTSYRRRQCAGNIPDPPPPPSAPAPVQAPELELEEEDEVRGKKKRKAKGKQSLRLTGLTIGGALGGGAPKRTGLSA